MENNNNERSFLKLQQNLVVSFLVLNKYNWNLTRKIQYDENEWRRRHRGCPNYEMARKPKKKEKKTKQTSIQNKQK